MPATTNQAHGNRCEKQRDYFRCAAQPLFAHPARKLISIAERDRDQCKIYQKRDQGEKQADGIDQNQESGKQRGPGNQRHTEWNNAEFVASSAIMRPKAEQFAPGQAEQDQSTGDLKIRNRDSKRGENNLPEKNKSDGNAESREDSQKRLSFSMLARCARAKTHEDRDEPDRIDGDKDWNKCEEKFLNHAIRAGISLYAMNVLHNVRRLQQSNLSE